MIHNVLSKESDMPNLDEAPREIVSTVKQSAQSAENAHAPRKTHPMLIIAAGAVTLFSAVGIAMMTGILPNAQSKSDSGAAKSESSAPLTSAAAGAAAAGVGTMIDAPQTQTPTQTQTQTPPSAPSSDLKPLDSKTVGQPMAKADQSIAAQKSPSAPKPTYTQSRPTVVASASPRAPMPNPSSSSERAPSSGNSQPTPVYAQNSAQNGNQNSAPSQPDRVASICRSCGTVDSINAIDKAGQGSGAGALLGGVLGGVLGHQVGNGRGRDAATVAGAVGGAVLGNQVEKNNKTARSYEVRVRMEDNTFSTVRYEVEPNVRVGDKVRVEDGRLVRG
jgi:outer membrane lipoprotein SlyB